jgi:hypothetical protein
VLANACTTPSTPATTPLNSDLTGSIYAVRSTIANGVGSSDMKIVLTFPTVAVGGQGSL